MKKGNRCSGSTTLNTILAEQEKQTRREHHAEQTHGEIKDSHCGKSAHSIGAHICYSNKDKEKWNEYDGH